MRLVNAREMFSNKPRAVRSADANFGSNLSSWKALSGKVEDVFELRVYKRHVGERIKKLQGI